MGDCIPFPDLFYSSGMWLSSNHSQQDNRTHTGTALLG